MPAQLSGNSKERDRKIFDLRYPILATLVSQRIMCLAIGGMIVAHLVTSSLGGAGWFCPLRTTVGMPCPGCGMTRAVQALLLGEWTQSLALHAFALLFVVAILLIGVAGFLPDKPRQQLASSLAAFERRTGVTALALYGVVVYWLIRLLLFRESFFALVQ